MVRHPPACGCEVPQSPPHDRVAEVTLQTTEQHRHDVLHCGPKTRVVGRRVRRPLEGLAVRHLCGTSVELLGERHAKMYANATPQLLNSSTRLHSSQLSSSQLKPAQSNNSTQIESSLVGFTDAKCEAIRYEERN